MANSVDLRAEHLTHNGHIIRQVTLKVIGIETDTVSLSAASVGPRTYGNLILM